MIPYTPSEEIAIPYRGLDNRIHRYFPDFKIKYENARGNIIVEIIEVKPKAQTKKPTKKNSSRHSHAIGNQYEKKMKNNDPLKGNP